MLLIHEPVDEVEANISEASIGDFWFKKLDLKNAYSQLALEDFKSKKR